jgi:hypothetical protein
MLNGLTRRAFTKLASSGISFMILGAKSYRRIGNHCFYCLLRGPQSERNIWIRASLDPADMATWY